MPDLRSDWICSECGMRCYKMTGEPFPAPTGWDLDSDRCLRCTRDDEDPYDKARRELLAGKSPSRIMVKGVSKEWMHDTQQELVDAGELDPAVVSPKPSDRRKAAEDAKLPAVRDLLKADPTRTNKEIGSKAEVGQGVVKRLREELGLKPATVFKRERRDEEVAAALREQPEVSNAALGERFGVTGGTVGIVRKRLGIPNVKRGPKKKAESQATVGSN